MWGGPQDVEGLANYLGQKVLSRPRVAPCRPAWAAVTAWGRDRLLAAVTAARRRRTQGAIERPASARRALPLAAVAARGSRDSSRDRRDWAMRAGNRPAGHVHVRPRP